MFHFTVQKASGLVMAESMYVGTPVIATDWSGNTEFMNSDTACMVGYDMIELDKDYEPFKKGNVWADAHVDEAKRLYEKRFMRIRISTKELLGMVRNMPGNIWRTSVLRILSVRG